jgi:hypothetical protein
LRNVHGQKQLQCVRLMIILSLPCREHKRQDPQRVKYWEIIADNLSKAGWSWGCISPCIAKGERSGLLTHIAAMETGTLCGRTNC